MLYSGKIQKYILRELGNKLVATRKGSQKRGEKSTIDGKTI